VPQRRRGRKRTDPQEINKICAAWYKEQDRVTQEALDAWAQAYGLRGILEDVSISDAGFQPSDDVGAAGAVGAVGANEGGREVFWL
jgi:hypothetical protein